MLNFCIIILVLLKLDANFNFSNDLKWKMEDFKLPPKTFSITFSIIFPIF